MAKKISTRGLRKHRIYRIDEAARCLGVCKATVRRWVSDGLPAVSDKRPFLIRGADLIAFLNARKAKRRRCDLGECFCVKCRAPKRPIAHGAHITLSRAGRPQLRGECADCGTSMMKPVRRAETANLAALLADSQRQAS